jgi:hypothetical protein
MDQMDQKSLNRSTAKEKCEKIKVQPVIVIRSESKIKKVKFHINTQKVVSAP